jgi:tetratricopeptide (TPR) repeat protein
MSAAAAGLHASAVRITLGAIFAFIVPVTALGQTTAADFYNRGVNEEDRGDLDGAIADYSRAIELDPNDAVTYRNRANTRQAAGDLDGAIADCSRAIELDPELADAYFIRGNAHFRQRHWTDALADFQRVCELNPKKQDYPRFDIWLIRARLGEKDAGNEELATYMEQRTAGTPGDWPSNIGSFLLGKMNEPDFLTAAASKNAKVDRRQHCVAWFYTGMKHLLVGDKAAAAECFTKCLATGEKSNVYYGFAEAELRALGK